MNPNFSPATFVQLFEAELKEDNSDQERTISRIVKVKDFFGKAFVYSDESNRDRRRKRRDKLLHVEDTIKKEEANFKEVLSNSTFTEFNKFLDLIKNRNAPNSFPGINHPDINFIGAMYDVNSLSEETLILLKGMQIRLLPEENIPFYVDN